MPNELVPGTAEYLDSLVTQYGQLAEIIGNIDSAAETDEFASGVPLSKLMPSVKMSDNGRFGFYLGGDEFTAPAKTISFIIVSRRARRALWLPQGADDSRKTPVCSTRQLPVSHILDDNIAKGSFEIGLAEPPYQIDGMEEYQPGDRVEFECRHCQWGEFKSKRCWDSKSDSDGQACSPQVVYYIVPVVRVANLIDIYRRAGRTPTDDEVEKNIGIYDFDPRFSGVPYSTLFLALNYGSNREAIAAFVQKKFTLPNQDKLPYSAVVWDLTIEVRTPKPSIKYAVANVALGGMLMPRQVPRILNETKPWLDSFLDSGAVKTEETAEEAEF